MNVERLSRLLPACGDRWLPSIVAEAFTVEHPVPDELQCILHSLENRRAAPDDGASACPHCEARS